MMVNKSLKFLFFPFFDYLVQYMCINRELWNELIIASICLKVDGNVIFPLSWSKRSFKYQLWGFFLPILDTLTRPLTPDSQLPSKLFQAEEFRGGRSKNGKKLSAKISMTPYHLTTHAKFWILLSNYLLIKHHCKKKWQLFFLEDNFDLKTN